MKNVLFSLLCVLMFISSTFAQQGKTITGTVTDQATGQGLPGVTVVVKGTSVGASTEVNGKYTINAPSDGATLVFSFIGYGNIERAIGGATTINVAMGVDAKQLGEVVITGVGVATDKRKVAISVESVSAKDLPQAPSASIDQALIGKIPGAQITSTSGSPGADVNILLRGINTINRGTGPMILVDGVQMGATNLSTIDLSTIDRVEVIQGAAAATIYGAQGANGVIQLFTKKGQRGKINVDFSSSVSANTYINEGGVRKAQYHAFATDANNNVIGTSGQPLVLDPATLTYSENVIYNPLDVTSQLNKAYDANLQYYDHYKSFFQTANTFNNSVGISGGGEKVDFAVTVSNNKQESNIRNNGNVSRTNLTSNVGIDLYKGLTLRSITQLAYTKNTIKFEDRDIMFSLNNARPFANFEQKDTDGDYGLYFGDAIGVNHWNPLYYGQYLNQDENKIDVIQNFNLNYKFPKFLEFDVRYGVNYQRREREFLIGNQINNNNATETQGWYSEYNSGAPTGEIINYSYNNVFQNFLPKATFITDFQEDFGLSVPLRTTTQVGFDWRSQTRNEYFTAGLGLPDFTPVTAAQASTYRILTDYTEPFVTYGYLVTQRFDYSDFVGISGGFRSDYSSAFGQGSKPFTFPRGDAYFRLSGLNFWETSKMGTIMPELKFRAAYGQAGIQPQPFDRYPTLSTRSLGSSTGFYLPSTQSNPDLSVEVSEEIEVGADMVFSLLKNTSWLNDVTLSATYWDRSTNNSIYNVDVAPSTGIGKLKNNAFSIGSHGFQASLTAALFNNNNFNWNFTTNFGKQTSMITSTSGQEIVVLSSAGSTNYVLRAGEKIGQLYGYISLHDVTARMPNGEYFIPEAQQEDYEVASNGYVVNKATKQPYFSANMYSFGDPNPDFNMSFVNDFTFKNFLNFSFQFDWVHGSHLYNQTKEWMYRDGIHSDYEKPITINGETGAWTAFYRGVYAQRQANGTKDYFYEDASFVRLRNVSLGIELNKIIDLPAFRKLQLVFTGRNLLTFTDYTGMDPEVSSGTNNSAFDRGTDHNTMPNYKAYQIGLNIGL